MNSNDVNSTRGASFKNGQNVQTLGFLSFPDISAKWIPVITGYAVALGFIDQAAFWHSFDIPIMDYVGWTDVVRITLVPLLVTGAALVIFSALGTAALGRLYNYARFARAFPLEKRAESYRRIRSVGLALYPAVFLLALFAMWNADHPLILLCMLMSGGIVGGLFAVVRPTFFKILIVTAILVPPWMSWIDGTARAGAIKSGERITVAVFPSGSLAAIGIQTAGVKGDVISLGHVGDYDFFYFRDRTYIARSTSLPTFAVYRREVAATRSDKFLIPFIDRPRIPLFMTSN